MMTMTTRYPSYNISISEGLSTLSEISPEHHQKMNQTIQEQQELQHQQIIRISSATAAAALVNASKPVISLAPAANNNSASKDYFIPLHVDCSVEYELPNQPKPPAGQRVEPLLMIHPCYFRKMESQRRSPFINNMPITSRNSTAILSASAALSSSNATEPSSSVSSSKRIVVRNNQQPQILHQHHYNTRQTTSVHYSSSHHNINHQHLLSIQTTLKNTHQNTASMSHQVNYPEVPLSAATIQFLDHSSDFRCGSAAGNRCHQNRTVSSSSQQIKNSTHKINPLVQKSSSSTPAKQWDQLSAVSTIVTSVAKPHVKINSVSNTSTPSIYKTNGCSLTNSTLGKRDAMISGGYSTNSNNTIFLRSQNNRLKSTNANFSCKHNNTINQNRTHGVSSSLDTPQLNWNTTASFMIDRGPMATVPSNFQAGPDSTLTLKKKNKISHDNKNANKNNTSSNGKYKQNVISHRVNPYTKTSTSSSANEEIKNFPLISVTKTVLPAKPSFQQHLRQISCFNV